MNNMGCVQLFGKTGKQCVKYYSIPDANMFSWDPQFNYTNNVNMTKEAILHHGKFC